MFEFLKRFFGVKTPAQNKNRDELIKEAINVIDECLDSIDLLEKVNSFGDVPFIPLEAKTADVKMWEELPRITIKEFRLLGMDIPQDIDERCIVCLSTEAIQDTLVYAERISAPNSLGDLTDQEIENWSDGEEILDKIDMKGAYDRVHLDSERDPPYQEY